MSSYEFRFTKEAKKDIAKLTPKLKSKLQSILINILADEPLDGKPLVADLKSFYSLRLSYKDRIVYTIDKAHKVIFIHRVKTHYGD